MDTIQIKRHTWFKVIAVIVMCLFTIDTITQALPASELFIPQTTLQVQSLFNPILQDEYAAQLAIEFQTIIVSVRNGLQFQDINAALDKGYSSVKSKTRILNILFEPVRDKKTDSITVELEFLCGRQKGQKFNIAISSKDTVDEVHEEISPVTEPVVSNDEDILPEIPNIKEEHKAALEKTTILKTIFIIFLVVVIVIFPLGAMFINNAIAGPANNLVSLPTDSTQSSQSTYHLDYSDTLDGSNLDFELKLTDKVKWGLGVLEGNEEFSLLDASPYMYFTLGKTNVIDRRNYIGGTELKIVLPYLRYKPVKNYYGQLMEERSDYGVGISFYMGQARGFSLKDNLRLNVGWTGSLAGMALYEKRYGEYDANPYLSILSPAEGAIGGSLFYLPSFRDELTVGASTSGLIQGYWNQTKRGYEELRSYSGENNVWLDWTTHRLRWPVKVGIDYKDVPLEKRWGLSLDAFNPSEDITVGLTFERSSSRYRFLPDEGRLGINLKKFWRDDTNIEFRATRDMYTREDMLTVNLAFNWGSKTRIDIEKEFGRNRFTQGLKGLTDIDSKEFRRKYRDHSTYSVEMPIGEDDKRMSYNEFVKGLVEKMSYSEFTREFIRKQVKTAGDAVWFGKWLGRQLGSFHYDYDDVARPMTDEDVYDIMRREINGEGTEPMGVCRHIHQYVADMINKANIEGVYAYVAGVRGENGHIIVVLDTPQGVYLLDYGNVIATGTHDVATALMIYQQNKGHPGLVHDIYKNGKYLGQSETPDSRLVKRVFTAQEGQSASQILRGNFLEPLNSSRLWRRKYLTYKGKKFGFYDSLKEKIVIDFEKTKQFFRLPGLPLQKGVDFVHTHEIFHQLVDKTGVILYGWLEEYSANAFAKKVLALKLNTLENILFSFVGYLVGRKNPLFKKQLNLLYDSPEFSDNLTCMGIDVDNIENRVIKDSMDNVETIEEIKQAREAITVDGKCKGDKVVRVERTAQKQRNNSIEKIIKGTNTRSRQTIFHPKGNEIIDMLKTHHQTGQRTPIDVVIDLSLISKNDIEENMETWAYLILLCHNLSNVSFVLKNHAQLAEGKELSEALKKEMKNTPDTEEALLLLKSKLAKKALYFDISVEDINELLDKRVRNSASVPLPGMPTPIEIIITLKAYLEWMRDGNMELGLNQYPVAMDELTTLEEGVALRNFEAALTIGLSKAALVIAKRKDECKKNGEEKELPEIRRNIFKKLKKLYKLFFGNRAKLTEATLDHMIASDSRVRLNLAISLALPPITRMVCEALRDFHGNIQLLLQAV